MSSLGFALVTVIDNTTMVDLLSLLYLRDVFVPHDLTLRIEQYISKGRQVSIVHSFVTRYGEIVLTIPSFMSCVLIPLFRQFGK